MKRQQIVRSFGDSWTDNSVKAMTENPAYFVWWYTVKSVGLGIMVAIAAYYIGHKHGVEAKSK